VIDRLRALTGIHRATSTTSRPPRDYEENGSHYHFVSEGEFERKIDRGDFLEYARVYGDWKGLEASEVAGPMSRGEDVIIRTDVQGARRWRELLEGAVFVFLVAEDRETLRARLMGRNSEDPESLARRIAELEDELDDQEHNDYVVVNHHERLDDTVAEIREIIARERTNPERAAVRVRSEAV
jgi:guanylate kinase